MVPKSTGEIKEGTNRIRRFSILVNDIVDCCCVVFFGSFWLIFPSSTPFLSLRLMSVLIHLRLDLISFSPLPFCNAYGWRMDGWVGGNLDASFCSFTVGKLSGIRSDGRKNQVV